jgi:hypothetical protein
MITAGSESCTQDGEKNYGRKENDKYETRGERINNRRTITNGK